MSTTSVFKDIGIRKSKFVAKTHEFILKKKRSTIFAIDENFPTTQADLKLEFYFIFIIFISR